MPDELEGSVAAEKLLSVFVLTERAVGWVTGDQLVGGETTEAMAGG